jgi:DNA-binding winged helix-turn-helix (wHTH) protein/tetratricopeptide (TPR) repeat protein
MRPRKAGRIIRFGSFEVDIEEGRLTKSGIRIRLQEQPFRILVLLLENAGQLVTREKIREELWSNDTFVEFDNALNTTVGKLRAALSDSADNPRFLETVPRRGYRFVAPVTFLPSLPAPESSAQPITTPTDSGVAPISPEVVLRRIGWRRPTVIALLVVIGLGIRWYQQRSSFQITSKDKIVLADFVNTTGETVFDDALRQGLEVGLEQSPFVKVLSDRNAQRIMKQMGRSPEDRMAGKTAIEVCQRANAKVTIQGSIANLGSAYLIGLAAIRCDNSRPIANEQVQATRKEDVVDALGQATAKIRSRLGESLPSIQKFNAPLHQATTSSLEALNVYGLALSTWDREGDRASLPIFQKAVDLDPNFAYAHVALATVYRNLGESDLARENATEAYKLRGRVTESERFSIDARYYAYVTGELEKVLEVHTREVQNYSDSPGAYNHLGNIEGELGRYEQSVPNFRKALLLDPTRANTYYNLATDLLALNRVDEASAVWAEANQRKLQSDALLQLGYWIAFLRGDAGEMQRLLRQSADVLGAQAILLSEQSNTEAYHGHFEKARELSRSAADLLEKDSDKEAASRCLAQAAVREAEVGNSSRAQEFISQAQKLSRDQDTMMLIALSMALTGNARQAGVLGDELDKQWPLGTYVQKYWLPLIRGEVDMRGKRSSRAVDDLNVVVDPLEFATPSALSTSTLYPTYARGQAYLAAGDGAKAAAEFQKLIDHPGLTINYPLGALARLGLARAYAHSGNIQKARQAYQDFFEIWKDADSDLPPLKDAKSELAKLT